MTKTEMNIAAAKLQHGDDEHAVFYISNDGEACDYVSQGILCRTINIFKNAYDCLAAEEALGERGISVCGTGRGTWFIWDEPNQTHLSGTAIFDERKIALGAACVEVMK